MNITSRQIIDATASAFGQPVAAILGPSRLRAVVRARQAAAHLIRHRTPRSFPEIGATLRRDHTTIVHAVRHVDVLLARDGEFAERYRAAVRRINAIVERLAAGGEP